MTADLFIRSYYKDFRWLTFCLRSVAKYAHGFRKVILVVPESSASRLDRSSFEGDIDIQLCGNFEDDYLGQQVTKLYADLYTDADFICHIDADCLFWRDTRPDDLMQCGRAIISITPYSLFPKERAWQRLSEEFMTHPVQHDFMRRQPFLFPRWLYSECRIYAEAVHQQSLSAYVLSRFPGGFSEYNALGALAYHRFHDRFVWRERRVWAPDESVCRWFWSWGGISGATQREIDDILN